VLRKKFALKIENGKVCAKKNAKNEAEVGCDKVEKKLERKLKMFVVTLRANETQKKHRNYNSSL
jgi:hypothetical protein